MIFLSFLVVDSYAQQPIQRTLDKQSQQFLEGASKYTMIAKHPITPLKKTEDLKIYGASGTIPIRIYTPRGKGPFPVVLYFAGGGWVSGDLNSNDSICREMCSQTECLIVSVEYHKAPTYPFPHALEDLYTALLWTEANIHNYEGQTSWIAVSGDSAGGNLAAALTLLTRDRKGPELQCQVLMYPVTNYCFETHSYYQNAKGYGLTKDRMKEFWGHYLQKANGKNPYVSPLQGDLTNLPSAFILTAEFDPLRDDGLAYAHQLNNYGVPVVLKNYPTIHAFISHAYYIDLGKQGLKDIAAYLKEQYAK